MFQFVRRDASRLMLQGPSSITARKLVEVLFCVVFVCIKLLGNVCESVP